MNRLIHADQVLTAVIHSLTISHSFRFAQYDFRRAVLQTNKLDVNSNLAPADGLYMAPAMLALGATEAEKRQLHLVQIYMHPYILLDHEIVELDQLFLAH